MSVTTSSNTVTQSVLRVLADYEVHHSGETNSAGIDPEQNQRHEPPCENPVWWPTDHRRVPDYRPIDRNLDRESRPAGAFFVQTCFILTMLGGVTINSHAATLWRNTGGRINNRIFRYPIGGEK